MARRICFRLVGMLEPLGNTPLRMSNEEKINSVDLSVSFVRYLCQQKTMIESDAVEKAKGRESIIVYVGWIAKGDNVGRSWGGLNTPRNRSSSW